jgi:hypothetical protein
MIGESCLSFGKSLTSIGSELHFAEQPLPIPKCGEVDQRREHGIPVVGPAIIPDAATRLGGNADAGILSPEMGVNALGSGQRRRFLAGGVV